MSVIRFILYCFDLFFDSVRSRPLLYALFFFPIFAAALLVLLSVVQRLFMVPESSDVGLSRRGFGVLRLHGNKSDSKAIAVNLATTNHKLDSIDHKLGKVSTSSKLGSGKGVSAGFGKGKSFNSIGSADSGLRVSRGLRSFFKSKFWKNESGKSVNLSGKSSSDNSTSIGPQMYDDNTTLSQWLPYTGGGGKRIDDVNVDIDVDD